MRHRSLSLRPTPRARPAARGERDMAVGNVVGGVVGAKLAIKQGNRLILVLLIVVMIATGIKLLWPYVAS